MSLQPARSAYEDDGFDGEWASEVSLECLEAAAAPSFWTAEILPAGTTTLLGAHGGVGKSQLALQWAVSIACGLPFLGKATRQGRVLLYSAEDDGNRIRHRLLTLCKRWGVDPSGFAGRLRVLDATAINPSLYSETAGHVMRSGRAFSTTKRYDRLREDATWFGADVIVIDNASDTFDADENARPQVRAFMRSLNALARERGAAVLLLAHVDKYTAKGTGGGREGYSGSTAWHNSARSRLFLSDKDGVLTLEHQKCNLGEKSAPMQLAWVDGVMAHTETTSADRAATPEDPVPGLLRLIEDFTRRGDCVAVAPTSPSNARKLFAGQSSVPRHLKRGTLIFDLLRNAESANLLEREVYRTPDRKLRERWRVTSLGKQAAGIAQSAPSPGDDADGAVGADVGTGAAPSARPAHSPAGLTDKQVGASQHGA